MQRASPELFSAARWALYVERLMPLLTEHRITQGTPLPSDFREKAAATPARLEANRQIELIRSVMFPED